MDSLSVTVCANIKITPGCHRIFLVKWNWGVMLSIVISEGGLGHP